MLHLNLRIRELLVFPVRKDIGPEAPPLDLWSVSQSLMTLSKLHDSPSLHFLICEIKSL